MLTTLAHQQNPTCPTCNSTYTVKKGRRPNRLRTLQVFQCAECQHKFTGAEGRNKTYPLKIILDAISTFNLGHSRTETQRILRDRAHIDIPERTISLWLDTYRPLATYSRLRNAGKKLFGPSVLVRSLTFHHQQVYRFQVHQAKLELLLDSAGHEHLSPLKHYLAAVEENFPHHLGKLPHFMTRKHHCCLLRPVWQYTLVHFFPRSPAFGRSRHFRPPNSSLSPVFGAAPSP